MEIRNCEKCKRDFFLIDDELDCYNHCSGACCRTSRCPQAKPRYQPMPRKCRTCSIDSRFFLPFAACDEGCTRIYYASEHIYRCTGLHSDEQIGHHPKNSKKRIHINYCSLDCWSSEYTGALEMKRQRQRVKDKNPERQSLRRWRKEMRAKGQEVSQAILRPPEQPEYDEGAPTVAEELLRRTGNWPPVTKPGWPSPG